MIAIVNTSPEGAPLSGTHEYEVRINRHVVTRFSHHRPDGLAECLERAADAVRRQMIIDLQEKRERILNLLGESSSGI